MTTAKASVKTTQVTDPRIEPQPDPVYTYVIGPTQNQYYRLESSACGDAYVAFNNLTTLGTDRAYLDTMELEITAEIDFVLSESGDGIVYDDSWTFDSFPFNKCCEQIRVNVNGGAFFSEPLCYLRAKERYMDQKKLSDCYENICPIHRAYGQTESGKNYASVYNVDRSMWLNNPVYVEPGVYTRAQEGDPYELVSPPVFKPGEAVPTRYGLGMFNAMMSDQGLSGAFNNAIVTDDSALDPTVKDHKVHQVYRVTWREPICCAPFSSRYDATYGRPLYNITSLDLAFNLQGLPNMIRVANMRESASSNNTIETYSITLKTVNLLYQVMTIPSTLNKPLTTLVPYRRFVPYITSIPDIPNAPGAVTKRSVKTGTYTINEMPTAIWLFVAPRKEYYQMPVPVMDKFESAGVTNNTNAKGNFDSNKLFGYINHVNISMANTTQLLNNASVYDLYRIAKANGCEDSFLAWGGQNVREPKDTMTDPALPGSGKTIMWDGPGSVLRLIPGVDLVVPDQALIPGANAKNMVFQVEMDVTIPRHSITSNKEYAIWLLFEYAGVAAISPGQCEVTMNPLGSGEVMTVSPVVSGTSEKTEGALSGSGWRDWLQTLLGIANQTARSSGIVSTLFRILGQRAREWEGRQQAGAGVPAKRACGGAVMGLKDWT